ncbi:eukaryotic translation initiation factor 4E isoform X2 [Hyalella azteca]|uniref:Eukaryotic translation initiation factor 4E isoform X2 n=1 Tax=Hyalella azteca TaxID=294128 RepID=A0A8B7N6V8_HYAAZ|nr:eukaryotic translation initiation factor 4E isoform X2 [Hyalella azteca]
MERGVPPLRTGQGSWKSQEHMKNFDPEPVLKHPLNSTWTLFYFINDKSGKLNYEECLAVVASFNTVEDFWALFNHIKNASKLKIGFAYLLFKNGILPYWDGSGNAGGGRWTLKTSWHQRFTHLDNYWLELIMMMVGEDEEECVNNNITGAIITRRMKQDLVSLWCAPTKKFEVTLKVGKVMKRCMGIPSSTTIEFRMHSNKIRSRSTIL